MFLWVGAEQEYIKMGEQNVIPWEKVPERISVFLWSRIIFWEWQNISVCWWEQHLNNKLRSKPGGGIEEKMFVVAEFKILALGKSQSGFANLLASSVRLRRERSPGEEWSLSSVPLFRRFLGGIKGWRGYQLGPGVTAESRTVSFLGSINDKEADGRRNWGQSYNHHQ